MVLVMPRAALGLCGPTTKNIPCVYFDHSATARSSSLVSTLSITGFSVPATSVCYDPILVVGISLLDPNGNVGPVASVTWNTGVSQSLTNDTGSSLSSSTNDNAKKRVEFWYLTGPATTTNGTVTATMSSGNTAQMVMGAILACGADQSSPILISGGSNPSTAGSTASSGIQSANGVLFVDILAVDGNITVTLGNSATLDWDLCSSTGTCTSSFVRGASSYKSSTSSSEWATWYLSASTFWVLGETSLKPWTPTAIGLESFDADSYDGGTVLRWHTGHEAKTLGYRVYREVEGRMVPVNRDVIVGSGLSFSGPVLQAGYSYSWFDPKGRPGDTYWLEDVEVGGESAWHGPFTARQGHGRAPRVADSRMLGETSRTLSLRRASDAQVLHGYAPPLRPLAVQGTGVRRVSGRVSRAMAGGLDMQWRLAAAGAAKIKVSAPGWYRLSFQALEAAGFHIGDSARLQLYADGVEQAIRVTDADSGGNRPTASSIEFFGVPNDTPASGTRTYWLVEGDRPGLRMGQRDTAGGEEASVATVPFTVQVKKRLVYVPGVLNGDRENFFGQAITADPAVEKVAVDHLAASSGQNATLRLALQGLTKDPFAVEVVVNGATVGKMEMRGAKWQQASFGIPVSTLKEGENTITLSRMDGSSISFVDTLELSYPRLTVAGSGQTVFDFPEAMGGRDVRLEGFTTGHVRVIDISAPSRPVELTVSGGRDGSGYYADLMVPAHRGPTTLLAFIDEQVAVPSGVGLDTPSSWHTADHRADMVIIGPAGFLPAADPLRAFHESEGLSVQMVDVQDIFDEFSYGAKDPAALKAFLARAQKVWGTAPKYVLLLGDGSYDPRDYLGFDEDMVPTKLIDTDTYETASDDWFADFNGDGIPEMAIGRLPVDSADEAANVIGKIVDREAKGVSLGTMLTVADQARGDNFALINQRLAEELPAQTSVQAVNEDDTGVDEARRVVLDTINAGVDFVNYSGHGTVDRWRGNVLTSEDAATLENGDHLTVFTMMNCLNGLFQEPLLEGLGEALIRAPAGGAVAVWASTATTASSEQELLVDAFYRNLGGQPGGTIGEAAIMARHATKDLNVRRSWVLLGDPAMRVEGAQ